MRARALARGDVNEARRARVPLVPLSRLKYFHALASEVETPNAPGAKPRTEFRRPGGTSGTCVQIVDRVVLILSFRAEREICFPLAPANSRFFVAPLLRMTNFGVGQNLGTSGTRAHPLSQTSEVFRSLCSRAPHPFPQPGKNPA
jgi:hypothetical protein